MVKALAVCAADVKKEVSQKSNTIFKETATMKKGILTGTVMVLCVVSLGYAQGQDGGLHGTIDVTYLSKYVWRGFDIYNDKSAIQPTIDLDLFGSGFGVSAMGHRANSGKYENSERWDYTLYYYNRLGDTGPLACNYRLGWVYYNYPDMTSHTTGSIDLQELQGIFSFPNLLGVERLVPTYVLVKLWPGNSGTVVGTRSPSGGTASGWAHIFMLDYGIPVEGLSAKNPEQMINLHTEVVFNDGVGPNGANVDHDWTNVVFGATTTFDMGGNYSLTPGVFHQITMDKSVNPDKDETWAMLSATYKF
jgi:hypothetical protein